MLDRAHLHAALQNGPVFNADALGDHIARQCTFAADVQTICALNVALHLAQDHNFAGADVGGDAAVASNGDAVFGKLTVPSIRPIDIERFGPADFPFDDHRAADGSLLDGHADGLTGGVGSRVTVIFGNLVAAASVARSLVFRAARTLGVTACGESAGRLAKLNIAREQEIEQVTEEQDRKNGL